MLDVGEPDRVAGELRGILRSLERRGRVPAQASELLDEIATGLAQSSPVETNLSSEKWVRAQWDARTAIAFLERWPRARRRAKRALNRLRSLFEELADSPRSLIRPGRPRRRAEQALGSLGAEARLRPQEAQPEVLWSMPHSEITSLTGRDGAGESPVARIMTVEGRGEKLDFKVASRAVEQACVAMWERYHRDR